MFSTKNSFTLFLEKLNVKHTRYYADKLYNEHPHKNNLFGLSDMLSAYGVENAGFRVENKTDIYAATPPFIAFAGGDFVVVNALNPKQTNYVWNGKSISIATDEFFKIWSGIVLMAQPCNESGEPDYILHKQKENINNIKNYVAGISLVIAFFIVFTTTKVYANSGLLLLLIMNLAGAYIAYLLLLKHLHVSSTQGDKICSLFKQTDCNNILESDAASLFGIISWSEIGLSYFISNTAIILFFPHLAAWMGLINMAVLPYSFWSIWYQGFRAKQWCPLCVMVQVLLWVVFLLNVAFGFVRIPIFDIWQIGMVGSVYLIPLLVIHIVAPLAVSKRRVTEITQEMNSIKANEKVFTTLLQDQPRYDVSADFSRILLGSDSATLFVTVLTNPHCNPCAKMHERIEGLLKKHPHIQVQYVFSSFSQELEISARYLIAVFLQKSKEERKRIYAEWFEGGKFNKEAFFEKYPVDIKDAGIAEEFNRHKAWIKIAQVRATPTVLVNGYKLPDNYKIEDLKYFMDLAFEI